MPQKIPNQNPITEDRMRQLLKEYPTKKDLEEFVTKKYLEKTLEKYATKKDLENAFKASETHTDYKLARFREEIDEKAREYRDQLMTKLDYIVGELADMREDRVIGDHHTKSLKQKVENHKVRIAKLETTH